MDIGDPSDFPATRRRLPSMRELGAFDADRSATAPASPAPERLQRNPANASPTPDAPPASERAAPTAAQLRRAIAKADPGTRRRLIRLYGRRDQQKAAANNDETTRPPLRLDEHTELLCASPTAADESSRAGRASRFDSPVSEAVAVDAPRVLFPIYDPAEHGADLRTPRRAAAPVEGHFPPAAAALCCPWTSGARKNAEAGACRPASGGRGTSVSISSTGTGTGDPTRTCTRAGAD